MKDLSYQLFVQQAADAICLYDIGSKTIKEANPAFCKSLGYKPEEIPSLKLHDFIAYDKANIDRGIEQVIRENFQVVGECQWRAKDGHLIDVFLTLNHVKEGARNWVFMIAHDITESKKARKLLLESEQRFSLLFDAVSFPIALARFPEAILIDVNDAFGSYLVSRSKK